MNSLSHSAHHQCLVLRVGERSSENLWQFREWNCIEGSFQIILKVTINLNPEASEVMYCYVGYESLSLYLKVWNFSFTLFSEF